ncbi:unnamed protein product [Protopolystoma xenopodis]|uniref:Uncharacterized protein n=1 Tax=Protopolystoma xenopodis TaxID=117903 RepID=A0A3S5AVT5_9PLAT|nr:unnamed protein product [Protopolystoma xenopodis]
MLSRTLVLPGGLRASTNTTFVSASTKTSTPALNVHSQFPTPGLIAVSSTGVPATARCLIQSGPRLPGGQLNSLSSALGNSPIAPNDGKNLASLVAANTAKRIVIGGQQG